MRVGDLPKVDRRKAIEAAIGAAGFTSLAACAQTDAKSAVKTNPPASLGATTRMEVDAKGAHPYGNQPKILLTDR